MKHSIVVLAAFVCVLTFASVSAFAQRGHGGSPPAGVGPGVSHGPSGTHGPSDNSGSQPSRSEKKTASDLLTSNTKLDNKLTAMLQSQGLLPKGTDLKDACSNFRNLGQCIAAIHVSHNRGISFNCLKWDMTGVKPSDATTGCSGPANGKAMSLGKAVQTLDPNANAKAEAKKANQQAADDLKESDS